MSDLDKLFRMYLAITGPITGSCYLEGEYDDDGETVGVNLMKDGNLCAYSSTTDILFQYITKDWGE